MVEKNNNCIKAIYELHRRLQQLEQRQQQPQHEPRSQLPLTHEKKQKEQFYQENQRWCHRQQNKVEQHNHKNPTELLLFPKKLKTTSSVRVIKHLKTTLNWTFKLFSNLVFLENTIFTHEEPVLRYGLIPSNMEHFNIDLHQEAQHDKHLRGENWCPPPPRTPGTIDFFYPLIIIRAHPKYNQKLSIHSVHGSWEHRRKQTLKQKNTSTRTITSQMINCVIPFVLIFIPGAEPISQ